MVNSFVTKKPGKIILFGEHSVLYKSPALYVPLDLYSEVRISDSNTDKILFELADLSFKESFTLKDLRVIGADLSTKYQQYLSGEINIDCVLSKTEDLAIFIVWQFLEEMESQEKFPHLFIKSSIPFGCGGGSSASIIVATISALCNYLNMVLSNKDQYKVALLCENLQHGRSSGGDITAIMNNKPTLVTNNQFQIANLIIPHFHVVNTGSPHSTTGESVSHAAKFFDQKLIQEFSQVTNDILYSIKDCSPSKVKEHIKDNHRLLAKIGVVPNKIQRFISHIETKGGSAKISGSGAIRGDNAGFILIFGIKRSLLESINKQFRYQIIV